MRYAVWDIETTGFSPEKDAVIEIGVMTMDGDQRETKNWLLNHNIEIPEKITELTSITKDMIDAEGVQPALALAEFANIIKEHDINVTHNGISFDIPFIMNSMAKHSELTTDECAELNAHIIKTAIDTMVIVKGRKLKMTQENGEQFRHFARRVLAVPPQKGIKSNLTLTCEEYGVEMNEETRHRALGDVILTEQVYRKLTKQA